MFFEVLRGFDVMVCPRGAALAGEVFLDRLDCPSEL